MNIPLNIAIVGLGNLGWNLAKRLYDKGYTITQVVSRNTEKDHEFVHQIGASLVSSTTMLHKDLDLIFICLPDDSLQETADLIEGNAVKVHCSGSTLIFNNAGKAGVLYPFQTFTKGVAVNWQNVPVFIESTDDNVGELLKRIATDLSGNPKKATQEQRQAVHIAGVFGANFVNHTLSLAEEVLELENVSFDVLKPLLEETLRKAFINGPKASQTGPARRADHKMVAKHLKILEKNDSLHTFYKLFSNDILKRYTP